jgi:hypothetical protein
MNYNNILGKLFSSWRRQGLLYLLIPCLLATWLYAPALFYGKIQLFGDSIVHNLSVMELNRKMLHEGISPLWTNLLLGGHPYFAEGQGGFLNPLNFFVALFFNPITGQSIYHWLTIIVGAGGMFLLCRNFKCSHEASTFGALVVVFSAFWIQYHDNVTVSGSLCYLPWVFLCFEHWVNRPSIKSALWLAISMSLLIFAGYPQTVHGAMLYMIIRLLPTLFAGYIGNGTDNSFRQYIITGLAAAAVCAGLSAIQWLPLWELVSLSHRSGGTDIASVASNPFYRYVGGFLFSIADYSIADTKGTIFRGLGSAFVCFTASLALIVKPNHRIIGHLMATIFLTILGMEYATPVFEYLRNYSLVPGLKYFRVVHLYLGIGIIGIGLLSSIAIDRIQQQGGSLAGTTVLFSLWAGLVLRLRVADVAIIQYASFIGAYIVLTVFIFIKKQQWFGYAMLIFIVTEIVILRIFPVPFADARLLEKPQLVKHIQTDFHGQDYNIMDISSSWIVGLLTLWSPKLEKENRKAFLRISPSTNVLWNIPSIDGLLALPLTRHQLIQPKMKAEALGTDSSRPGTRLIDYLSVRYISTDAVTKSAGLEPWTADDVIIMENKHALPRIQTFTRYEIANSADDALNRLKQSKKPTLILEPPFNKTGIAENLPASTNINIPNALEILSAKTTNMQYKLDIYARQPAWLFIADANYPGWQAHIDGKPTSVYCGQILGKAVFVPAGSHNIIIEFTSRSFMFGVCLTLFTLIVVSVGGIRRIYRKRYQNNGEFSV